MMSSDSSRGIDPPPSNLLPALPLSGAKNPCLSNGCSVCCHDTEMLLTESDVARIAGAHPKLAFFFAADDGYLQLRTRDGPPANGGTGAPCIFLDAKGKCTIHDIRPEGCRLYPALWSDDVRAAELDKEHCPHTDGFALPTAMQDHVHRLAERLRHERRRRQR